MRISLLLVTLLGSVLLFNPGEALAQPSELPPRPEKAYEDMGNNVSRVRPANTPYERWFAQAKDHMPTFEGLVIQDARTYPLEHWTDLGVPGVYLKMADYQITDGWILELPAGGATNPQRHLFEAGMYFFGGPGHIEIQQEGRPAQRVPFQYRTLFSMPLNVRYRLVNESEEPVRVVVVTSFPFMMNATNNESFIFENPFAFRDRYDAGEDYLERKDHIYQNTTVTNLVPDALEFELDEYDHRGKDSTNMHWFMSGNTQLRLHVSEIPPERYKKAHRHSSDAFILLVSGEGYSTTWPGGGFDDRVTVEWQEGTIFVPPIYWYHQHLNPGSIPARYMAMNAPLLVAALGLRFEDQIELDKEEIREDFEARVTANREKEGADD